MLTLGQRLRKARKLRDLTQAELTKKVVFLSNSFPELKMKSRKYH